MQALMSQSKLKGMNWRKFLGIVMDKSGGTDADV